MNRSCRIVSVGMAVPENLRLNSYYEERLETSDEWIVQRTGIRSRHIWENPPADACAQLGAQAGKLALERAGLSAADIDTVLCATFTPDNFFPSTAVGISHLLGIRGAFALDVSAACSGFLSGLTLASSLIQSGQSQRVLLVGSEIVSRSLDFTDRGTCLLFGDGAGAVVLEACAEGSGVLACSNYSDGSLASELSLPAWDGQQHLAMNGTAVYKIAISLMPQQVRRALEMCQLTVADLDLLIPHQANVRIIAKVGEQLGIPAEKVVINVERYGNTSSATIPIALFEAWEAGRIVPGAVVALTALGGGITAGAAIVRF